MFAPLTLRGLTVRNRAWVSPMCQYSSQDGRPTDWHLVHLGGFARGGAGLVMFEATAVSPEGRITPGDAGLWTPEQAADYRRIVDFVHGQGAAAGVQLAHAGRKASSAPPWVGGPVPPARGGWTPIGPGRQAYGDLLPPRRANPGDLATVVEDFVAATRLALTAGFDVVEVHAAHGYLLHQFLSPLTNRRTDDYGGGPRQRARLLHEVVGQVRAAWPADRPLFVRLSVTDGAPGGWELADTVAVAGRLRGQGVDLLDCSAGGIVPGGGPAAGPGTSAERAAAVRAGAGLPTAAVGLITDPRQAEKIVANGEADAVFLAREMLRDPHWPLRAAAELGAPVRWPVQYERARPD